MLAALDRMADNDVAWWRADPLDGESPDAVFQTDDYKDDVRGRYLGA